MRMRIIMMRGKKKLMMTKMIAEEVAVVLRGDFVVFAGELGGEVMVEFN